MPRFENLTIVFLRVMDRKQTAPIKSIKPFRSSEDYLFAMKEDLADWLKDHHEADISAETFFEALETGSLLCQHANKVTSVATEFVSQFPLPAQKMQLPQTGVTFSSHAVPGTFWARDNVSNFIQWCRKEMSIQDVLMFETEDLVLRKNEKNFVLCLLEVARRASRFGMSAPVLIQMEEEIEEQIREELDLPLEETPIPKPQRQLCDFRNLDQMVQFLVSRCTCPVQFPMFKVSEGKYKVGDSNTLIFVRILRNHVMVRVGGGWDTLEHYLDKHDPCRCTSLAHRQTAKIANTQRTATPVHEIKACLPSRLDNHNKPQPTIIVTRNQAPPPPVEWNPSSSVKGTKPDSNSSGNISTSTNNTTKNSGSQTQEQNQIAHSKLRKAVSIPSYTQCFCEETVNFEQNSCIHAEKEKSNKTITSPRSTHSGGNSPRISHEVAASQLRKNGAAAAIVTQQEPMQPLSTQPDVKDSRSSKSWAKTHYAEPNAKRNTIHVDNINYLTGRNSSRTPLSFANSSTSTQSSSACKQSYQQQNRCRPPSPDVKQQSAVNSQSLKDLSTIRCPSPTKQCPQYEKQDNSVKVSMRTSLVSKRSPSPTKNYQVNKQTTNKVIRETGSGSVFIAGGIETNENHDSIQKSRTINCLAKPGNTIQVTLSNKVQQKIMEAKNEYNSVRYRQQSKRCPENQINDNSSSCCDNVRESLFSPPPIDHEQEMKIYRSLEEEIMSNIKVLENDLEETHNEDSELNESTTESCLSNSLQRSLTSHDFSDAVKQSSNVSPSIPPKKVASRADTGSFSESLSQEDSPHFKPSGRYDDVIAELSKGPRKLNRVDVENWIAKNHPKQTDKLTGAISRLRGNGLRRSDAISNGMSATLRVKQSTHETVDPEPRTQCVHNSTRQSKEVPVWDKPANGKDGDSTDYSSSVSSMKQVNHPQDNKARAEKPRRSLKKPERVPSIYKLKLRPKIRPRRDHRPDKNPSRIPTPMRYRQRENTRGQDKSEMAQNRIKRFPRNQKQLKPRGSQSSNTSLCSAQSTEEFGSEEDASFHDLSSLQDTMTLGRETVQPGKNMKESNEEESWV
ncbi:GAS2-like protein 2 [Protopterus annectens]|uniref:GAS2-like protein 2 n=1 Tax=Protopterus annectens TaxID=7888 RepID=UPI001CF9B724|nr:GAS2-like protein 2 [Protopterus annectens]